jgi:hypothetical protein
MSTITSPVVLDTTGQAIAAAIRAASVVPTEQTISTSGSVTQALLPNVAYHFTSDAITALTITLVATTDTAQYHFDFLSGDTAPTLTLPNTVVMPDGFAVDADMRYEIDILNGYGVAQNWPYEPLDDGSGIVPM